MDKQLVFDFKKYVLWCREHIVEVGYWAKMCDGQPTDGLTVTGKDGVRRFCRECWCSETKLEG